jgi:hypothetical protein
MVADLRNLFYEERTYRSRSGARDRAAGAGSTVLALFGGSSNCTHVIQVLWYARAFPRRPWMTPLQGRHDHPATPSSQARKLPVSHHTTTISITITSQPHLLHILIKLHLFLSFSFLVVAMKTSAILLAAATAGSTTAAVHRMKLNKVPLSEQLVSVSRHRLARMCDSLRLSAY